MNTKPAFLATALFLLAAGVAQAQTPDFTWRGTLAAGKTIEIRG